MFHRLSRILCAFLLACAFAIAFVVPAYAAQPAAYDPDAAVQYAKEHVRTEEGLCATFVSHCLTAGGVSVSESGAGNLLTKLRGMGLGRIVEWPEASDLHKGDVVGVVCGKHSTEKSFWGLHVILVSQEGGSSIRYYAVNNRRDNAEMTNAKLKKYNTYFSCNKCGSNRNTKVVAFCFDDASKTGAPDVASADTLTEREMQSLAGLCAITCELPDFRDTDELSKSDRLSLLHTAYWYDGLRYAGDFSEYQYYGENCEVGVDAANRFIKSVLGVGIPNASESGTFDVIVGSVVTCDGGTYTVEGSDFNAYAYLGDVESLGDGVFKVMYVRCAFDEEPTAAKFQNADYLIVKRSDSGYGFTVVAKNEPAKARQQAAGADYPALYTGGESIAESFVKDSIEEVSGFFKNLFGGDDSEDGLTFGDDADDGEDASASAGNASLDANSAADGAYSAAFDEATQDSNWQNSHSGDESPASDFLYTVANGEATVTGYTGSDAEVVIPRVLGGASVTAIGKNAFEGNVTMQYVSVPYGVQEIQSRAFIGCSSLTEMDLPEGLLRIAPGAFSKCIRLREAKIPKGVRSIGKYAFSACGDLGEVTFPSTLREMVAGAFSGCTSLTRIAVPEGLLSIPEDAFAGCKGLSTVVIPAGVVVYSGAFRNCGDLTIITPEGSSAYKFAKKFGMRTATAE